MDDACISQFLMSLHTNVCAATLRSTGYCLMQPTIQPTQRSYGLACIAFLIPRVQRGWTRLGMFYTSDNRYLYERLAFPSP